MNKPLSWILILLSTALAGIVYAQSGNNPQQQYIATYSGIAVSEMYRTGVPASITLAQGILESRAGLSPLASEGNNHFGIKCHDDWKGKTMKVDDDMSGECFRVYDSPEESFRDHSDFLRYKDRYKSLFENDVTDYKAWAYGLKKCGYATDPQYAEKLIKNIEDYHLYDYDKMTVDDAIAMNQGKVIVPEQTRNSKLHIRHRGHRTTATDAYKAEVNESIPASPLSIEEAKPLTGGEREEFRFSLSREMYSRNGVPFLYAVEGETYSSIADSYHLFIKEILRFNDLATEERLEPGTVVYLQAKKSQAPKGLDKYIVGDEEVTLRDICQRFAVKMEAVRKMNGFAPDYVPREGDTIILRGETLGQTLNRKIFSKKEKDV